VAEETYIEMGGQNLKKKRLIDPAACPFIPACQPPDTA
jgi:hypothetical protein